MPTKSIHSSEDADSIENIEERLIEPNNRRYELLDLLGKGGMGEVYRAFDHLLNRHVAIKFLKVELLDDLNKQLLFFKEAQTTAQLSHPYIVPIYDIGYWEDKGIFLVMQEIKGKSLTQLIREFHQLSDGWYKACEAVKF